MFIYVGLDAVVGNHQKNGICVYIDIEAVCCEGLLLAKICGKHAHTSGNFEIDVLFFL